MLGDTKASASKDKTKEDSNWRAEWWDFYPLVERPQRPLVWANCSIIFTAHLTQPLVTGHLFSSSKQFALPSPEPIFSSPSSYQPPAIISVSPTDDWLFAYFPGCDGDGTGCLWKRGLQVDSWSIKDYWGFGRGAGVVTAAWAGAYREWVPDAKGTMTRLPPRGPVTPMSSPTLLLVTEDHQLNMCYLRPYMPSLKAMKCSLTQPSVVIENQPHSMHDFSNGPGGVRVCIGASIGLGYNESSILIAMRSRLYPSSNVTPPSFNTMDLGLSLDISQSSASDPVPSIEWESWGEEATIELCEVQLGFDGSSISILTNPLAPLHHSSGPQLTRLSFICAPPPQSSASDPTKSPASTKTGKLPKRTGETQVQERGQIYLAASFIDFGDYSSLPQSELVLYTISRTAAASGTSKATWLSNRLASRSFSSDVLAFIIPRVVLSSPHNAILYAGTLDSSGTIPFQGRTAKEMPIGRVTVLNLPDLVDGNEWEKSTLMVSINDVGREIPLNVVVSPNHVLLSAVSSSPFATRTTIHTLPTRLVKDLPDLSSEVRKDSSLSTALMEAIHSRKTTADVTRIMSFASTSVDQVFDTLYATLLTFLEGPLYKRMAGLWTWEILGIAIEIYGAKALLTRNEGDRESLLARLQIAQDLCSIAVCNSAFEDCEDGDGYDLEAVWQLIGMSQWAIGFTEMLMKQCILLNAASVSESLNEAKMDTQSDGDDLFGSAPTSPAFEVGLPTLETPILLYIGHPYALGKLKTLLTYVKRLRFFVGQLSARGENAQIARDVLVDLVDYAGFDIDALCLFLNERVQDAITTPAKDALRSLAMCQPTSAMGPSLRKAIEKLTDASIINKPLLFIKSSDLVDGISRMSLVEHPNKEEGRDIVSKALLSQRGITSICMRCGGQSEVGGDVSVAGHISLRWMAWERVWTIRCVCGGLWAH